MTSNSANQPKKTKTPKPADAGVQKPVAAEDASTNSSENTGPRSEPLALSIIRQLEETSVLPMTREGDE